MRRRLARRLGARDVGISRIAGAIVGANAITIAGVFLKARVRIIFYVGTDRGDLHEIGASGSGTALDFEARLICCRIDPSQIDLTWRDRACGQIAWPVGQVRIHLNCRSS